MTPLSDPLHRRIQVATGQPVRRAVPLSGGCVADVMGLELADGRRLVLKQGDGLAAEGRMLRDLADAGVPAPVVLIADDDLLVMTRLDAGGRLDAKAQRHLADIMATLHDQPRDGFGYAYDTVIGGLHQPNPLSDRWLPFLAEHRFLSMATEAHTAGRLPKGLLGRVERLCGRLDRWLTEPAHPSLIHGDLWGGNILVAGGRITGLIDPALYHADPEIELAFGTLFGTLSDAFFRRYQERRPIAPGFFEERRELYNLYPLLVHVRLFGGSYVGAVERTLEHFGA